MAGLPSNTPSRRATETLQLFFEGLSGEINKYHTLARFHVHTLTPSTTHLTLHTSHLTPHTLTRSHARTFTRSHVSTFTHSHLPPPTSHYTPPTSLAHTFTRSHVYTLTHSHVHAFIRGRVTRFASSSPSCAAGCRALWEHDRAGTTSAGSVAGAARAAESQTTTSQIDLKVSPVGVLMDGRWLRAFKLAMRARAVPARPQAGFS
jgi:hypothetical protein